MVELSAGEVVYIGNLDAAFCIRHAYANQYGIAGVRLYVNDKSDRDIPLLREKFHALRNISIDRRVLNDSFMQQQLGYLSQCCSGEKKYTLDL
jgi:hypothetical protein